MGTHSEPAPTPGGQENPPGTANNGDMDQVARKLAGAYYTPGDAAECLVRWAVRHPRERMLDPACGDGRFLALHSLCTGVERDPGALAAARERAPWAETHEGDFFAWAAETSDRFDCAAGNPPFIRYQRFAGPVRRQALSLCDRLGVGFTGLTSSWAPFLVAAASLIVPGGRMAFVVPAEIGHAPYAAPLLQYLTRHFDLVQVVALREKLFSKLSEDCWLLYAAGCGGRADHVRFTVRDAFEFSPDPPADHTRVSLADWMRWNCRLRPFVLADETRALYEDVARPAASQRLGEVARVSIGYVTGDNDFFHLRPSQAEAAGIPPDFLRPSVRNGKALPAEAVTNAVVQGWVSRDEPVLLLRVTKGDDPPAPVRRYLDSPAGQAARRSYKCRNRRPWYVVPDVVVPDAFLPYMNGGRPPLVANRAACVGTNSMHVVTLRNGLGVEALQRRWQDPLVELSTELEGHPLGGGLLKLEPGEAARVVLPREATRDSDEGLVLDGTRLMRRWRHYGQ